MQILVCYMLELDENFRSYRQYSDWPIIILDEFLMKFQFYELVPKWLPASVMLL